MNKTHRSKMEIYGDLLNVLDEETKNEKIVVTRILHRINAPHDRFKTYIFELYRLGLIKDEITLKLTDKGKEYLKGYEQIVYFMEHMGLTK